MNNQRLKTLWRWTVLSQCKPGSRNWRIFTRSLTRPRETNGGASPWGVSGLLEKPDWNPGSRGIFYFFLVTTPVPGFLAPCLEQWGLWCHTLWAGAAGPIQSLDFPWIGCFSWMALMLLELSGWMLYGSLRVNQSRCSALMLILFSLFLNFFFSQWHYLSTAHAAGVTRARGTARAPGGAARRPLTQVLGNRSMEVPSGGAGCHGDHPGVTDGLVSGQAGGRIRRQKALDEVLCQVGYWGPRLCERKKQNRETPSVWM